MTVLLYTALLIYLTQSAIAFVAIHAAIYSVADAYAIPRMSSRRSVPYAARRALDPRFLYHETRRSISLAIIEMIDDSLDAPPEYQTHVLTQHPPTRAVS